MRCVFPLLAFGLLIAFSSAWADEPKITVAPDKPTGVYAPNDKVTWTIDVTGDRSALTAVPYTIKLDAAR